MSNYKLGKIYMIYSIKNPEDRYYGSTTQSLAKRFYQHTKDLKKSLSSALLFEKYGIDGCKIELVEDFPCENKNQLRAREGYYIRLNDCVNKNIAGRSWKEYQDDYREKNKEKILETTKRCREKQLIVVCDCGTTMKQYNFTVHQHTAMHFKKLKNKLI